MRNRPSFAIHGVRVERHDRIEIPAGHTAAALGDDSRVRLRRHGYTHDALMRVSREPGDGIAAAAAQKCVHRTCGLDHLQVSISARMIVGKADRAGISIIDAMARQVRFSVYAVEEMGMTNFAELEQTRAEVMMIASEQQSPAARGEAANPIRSAVVKPAPTSTANSHSSSK